LAGRIIKEEHDLLVGTLIDLLASFKATSLDK
ncbi:MAG: hypothetical protein ACI9HA_001792, partial [Dinoroseobacter sp.]